MGRSEALLRLYASDAYAKRVKARYERKRIAHYRHVLQIELAEYRERAKAIPMWASGVRQTEERIAETATKKWWTRGTGSLVFPPLTIETVTIVE